MQKYFIGKVDKMGSKSVKKKVYSVRYAGSRGKGIVLKFPFNPRSGVCQACGKSVERGEIRFTALHHWWYAYQVKTVRKSPLLALENTSEFCFGCHQLADAIRALLYAKPKRVAMVAECLPAKYRQRFINVLVAVAETLQKAEKNVNPTVKKILEMVKK